MRLTARQRASWCAHLFKAATQQHHRELAAVFAPLLPAEAVVIDVGAHGGQFSKLFARLAPRGSVYAFEPSAYARSILRPALAVNRLSRVEVIAAGLSDAPGELVLKTPLKASTSLGYGTAHLGGADEPGPSLDQTVPLITLDGFVAERGLTRLDLIKADVEGWELRALIGGEAALRRFRPALYLEVDDRTLSRAGDRPETLFQWLAGLGYQAFAKPYDRPTDRWTGAGDYLFIAKA